MGLEHQDEIHQHAKGHGEADVIVHRHLEVPLSRLAQATLQVFTSKYYFTDDDDLLVLDESGNGPPVLHPKVVHELCGLAKSDETYIKGDLAELGSQVSAEDSEELTVGIDLWMDWLHKQYMESRANCEALFAKLYSIYDSNQDSCLDLKEFTALIHAVDDSRSDIAIMEMYNMALDCTGEGDLIIQDAFVYVAMHFHLPFKNSALMGGPSA